MAYAMCGGARNFYALPSERRLLLRKHARELLDIGRDFVTASLREDEVRDGFVYIVTHPSFPGYVKVGCAIDPHSRLRDYQTYCPRRAYRLVRAVYTTDRREAEAYIHAMLGDVRASGEWFRAPVSLVEELLDSVAEFNPAVFG